MPMPKGGNVPVPVPAPGGPGGTGPAAGPRGAGCARHHRGRLRPGRALPPRRGPEAPRGGAGVRHRVRRAGHGLRHRRRGVEEEPPAPPAPAAPAPVQAPPAPAPPPLPTGQPVASIPPPSGQPAPAPAPPPARLAKGTLTKDATAVSLTRRGGASGTMRGNPSWRADSAGRRFTEKLGRRAMEARAPAARCCRRRATSTSISARATNSRRLGRWCTRSPPPLATAFGALRAPPYILLDRDDGTGAVRGARTSPSNATRARFRRILIFVTVHSGARGFEGLNATVTLRPQHGAPVGFSLDACTVPFTVCAPTLITDTGGELVVQREAHYLVPEPGIGPRRTVDHAYGWGLTWSRQVTAAPAGARLTPPRRYGPSRPRRAPGSAAPRSRRSSGGRAAR